MPSPEKRRGEVYVELAEQICQVVNTYVNTNPANLIVTQYQLLNQAVEFVTDVIEETTAHG